VESITKTVPPGICRVLRDELRPYPGRTATMIRMAVACTVTTMIVMTFRTPYAFLGVFNAFVISRQRPEWLMRNGLAAVVASAAAIAYVAIGVRLFYDYPVLHFVFLTASLYLAFYLKRALTNDSVTFGFGVTAIVAMTLLWDRPYPTEAHLVSTLSLSLAVMVGTLVAMATAWVALELERRATPAHPITAVSVQPSEPLLARDAFSNPEYVRFGLKGCIAGLLCYVFDSGVAWPVIMGACAETCIVAARPLSSGAGTPTERLFTSVTALFVGGVVLGIGSEALVLPFVDSITGFTLQFVTVSAIAAWVATSSPRLAYAGTLGAMGYFFPMVERFGPNPSFARSGAFMGDVFIALVAFWLVFDSGLGGHRTAAGGSPDPDPLRSQNFSSTHL
jgi:hypothetical protein